MATATPDQAKRGRGRPKRATPLPQNDETPEKIARSDADVVENFIISELGKDVRLKADDVAKRHKEIAGLTRQAVRDAVSYLLTHNRIESVVNDALEKVGPGAKPQYLRPKSGTSKGANTGGVDAAKNCSESGEKAPCPWEEK